MKQIAQGLSDNLSTLEGQTTRRKDEHIAIVGQRDVAFRHTTTLLEGVQFIHESLPDLDLDEIDTSVDLMGKHLRVPLVIAGMTGGSEQGREINRKLAEEAESFGCAMGVGSQRAMLEQPRLRCTYEVRDIAPSILLFGNIGVVCARDCASSTLLEMANQVGVDALCVHMNPSQELVQPEGDRCFRGGLETMSRLARELPIPVVAKETGCGISYQTAQRLRDAGVRHVDVSGAGGTSWVAVEMERTRQANQVDSLGAMLREWGIPTASSVVFSRRAGL
ncbi:MAG: type 2 isopentenyl-diphosphate Delta-isomerase, partial [Polyangiaceae bacterium]|nr:type 2 isopentenyl-diphosphate Delta-isomerase [Polyangiaceae bacterium]